MEKKLPRRLEGKVAIVTASTQGIGFGIIERLGLEGASVVVSSRKQANVDEAVEKLKSKGIDAYGIVCHVSNAQHRRNLVEKTVQKYGKIDIVVCNAAANPSTDPILSSKEAILDKLWEINVKSSILLLQDIAPHLEKGSSVIFITSITGFQPQGSMAMYGVTKTALLGLTKALSAEMAPDTRVNAIAPGFVPTHFASFITGNSEVRKTIEEQTLLNRLGTTGDMAAAAAFLASDDVKFYGLPTQNQLAMSGLAHIPFILVMILSNFQCGTIIPNTPPRDDGSFDHRSRNFGQGSMDQLWFTTIMDWVGSFGSGL